MKPERGQYRAITVVLLDGPDFQKLPPEARWVFVALKIGVGPCGIQVEYPAGLVEKLAGRTGYTQAVVAEQLDTLQATGWIRTDRNVVWVVKQLKFEPAMTAKNEKHRVAVHSHVKGLPTLAIVGDFIREYRDYLPDWEELARSYPKTEEAQPIAYGIAYRITEKEDRGQKTETEEVSTTSAGAGTKLTPHSQASCMRLVVDHLYFGNRPPDGEMAKNGSVLRNFAARHGYDRMARMIEGLAILRNRGELHGVRKSEPVSLLWLNAKGMDLNQLSRAEDAYYAHGQANSTTTQFNSLVKGVVGKIGA